MLLVWHGTWRRHTPRDIVDEVPEPEEERLDEEELLFLPHLRAFKVKSVITETTKRKELE